MKITGIVIVGLLLAAGAAIGIFGARTFFGSGAQAPGLASAPGEPPAVLPVNLPPLEESDEFVRRRAAGLSPAAELQEWLRLESLIPRLAAAMNRIAHGGVPRDIFAAFAPRGKFTTVNKGGRVFMAPASYARFDGFTSMVQSVDAVAAAKVFEELLPLFDAAQRGLGEKNANAKEAFFAAVRELLQAPVPEGDVALKERKKGIGWAYAEDRLENLSLAQKQLLRMGPKNQNAVQAKLRAVALAMGATGL